MLTYILTFFADQFENSFTLLQAEYTLICHTTQGYESVCWSDMHFTSFDVLLDHVTSYCQNRQRCRPWRQLVLHDSSVLFAVPLRVILSSMSHRGSGNTLKAQGVMAHACQPVKRRYYQSQHSVVLGLHQLLIKGSREQSFADGEI